MLKHKIIFCREGVVAGFYRAVAEQCIFPEDVSSINVAAYGTATNSLGYPKLHLMSKYGNLLRSNTDSVEVFLCYDRQSTVFNQISPEDWKEIGVTLVKTFTKIEVTHIIHTQSIEDWLLADVNGLKRFIGKLTDIPVINGREYIKDCYRANNRTYVSSNESEGKKLIAALDLNKIVTAHRNDLVSLFIS
jgi:hypothetical protein